MNKSSAYRTFRVSDAMEINLHEAFSNDHHVRERIIDLHKNQVPLMTITFPESDSPLAVVGLDFLFTQVARAWTICDDEIKRFPKHYVKSLREIADTCFHKYNLNRLEIAVKADEDWSIPWASVLGFRLEGKMAKYGHDGADYNLFARVVK